MNYSLNGRPLSVSVCSLNLKKNYKIKISNIECYVNISMLHCIGKNDKKKNQWVQVFAFFHSQYFQCVLIECISQKAADREDFLHLPCSL